MKWLKLQLELVTPCFIGGAKGGSVKRDFKDFDQHQFQNWQKLSNTKDDREKNEAKRIKREALERERKTRDVDDLIDEIVRPASVIGHWRFWLRAILGARLNEPTEIRNRESLLFGNATSGKSLDQGQGIILVRPGINNIPSAQVVTLDKAPTLATLTQNMEYEKFSYEDPKKRNAQREIDPIGYLGYGIMDAAMDLALERPALRAGTQFTIEVAIRPRRFETLPDGKRRPLDKTESSQSMAGAWRDLRYTIWLWQTFGGLGARSRRGWGSVRIVGLQNNEAIPEEERECWQQWFGEHKKNWSESRFPWQQRFADLAHGGKCAPNRPTVSTGEDTDPRAPTANTSSRDSSFSHIGQAHAWFSGNTYPTWEEALAYVGKAMLTTRSNGPGRPRPKTELRVQDHDAVADRLYNSKKLQQAPYRAAFGLPHNYYFRNGNRQTSFTGTSGQQRRASPVLIHVAKMNNQYVPVVLWLKSRLTEGTIECREQKSLKVPDWSAVVEFFKELEPHGTTGSSASTPAANANPAPPSASAKPVSAPAAKAPSVKPLNKGQEVSAVLKKQEEKWVAVFTQHNDEVGEITNLQELPADLRDGAVGEFYVKEKNKQKQLWYVRFKRLL